jgi:hypothetical protein
LLIKSRFLGLKGALYGSIDYGRPYDKITLTFLRVWDPEEISAETNLIIEKASGVEFIGKSYILWDNSTSLEIVSY